MLRGFILVLLGLTTGQISCYLQPSVNLGLSNILDGGPLRPAPGFYWIEDLQYYQANKFFDGEGKEFTPSPRVKDCAIITTFLYQFPVEFLRSNPGISLTIPATAASHMTPNRFGFTDAGSGIGDLMVGLYLQGKYFAHHDEPIFIQRFEFDVSFPTGKYNTFDTFTPGNGFYFLQPYWAATFYFTPAFAASWRLNYLWNARDTKTHIKAGSSLFGNFDLEYEAIPHLWVAVNGYFFNQITDNKLYNHRIPNSLESVVALGPGAVYFFPKDFDFFVNAYFEMGAKNRTQGWKIVLRLFKQF